MRVTEFFEHKIQTAQDEVRREFLKETFALITNDVELNGVQVNVLDRILFAESVLLIDNERGGIIASGDQRHVMDRERISVSLQVATYVNSCRQ